MVSGAHIFVLGPEMLIKMLKGHIQPPSVVGVVHLLLYSAKRVAHGTLPWINFWEQLCLLSSKIL